MAAAGVYSTGHTAQSWDVRAGPNLLGPTLSYSCAQYALLLQAGGDMRAQCYLLNATNKFDACCVQKAHSGWVTSISAAACGAWHRPWHARLEAALYNFNPLSALNLKW